MGLIREQDEYRYVYDKREIPLVRRGHGLKHKRRGRGPFGASLSDNISTGLDLIDKGAKTATSVSNAIQKGFETARAVDDYYEQKEKRARERAKDKQEKEDKLRKKTTPKHTERSLEAPPHSSSPSNDESLSYVLDKIVLDSDKIKRASGLHTTHKKIIKSHTYK